MVFLEVDMEFVGSCCEHLAIKTSSPDFPQSEGIGNYHVYLDVEDEPFICYGASVFMNPESNTYLYRSKFGNWIVGKNMGKVKGAIIRSQEDEREKFALVCPCKVCLKFYEKLEK